MGQNKYHKFIFNTTPLKEPQLGYISLKIIVGPKALCKKKLAGHQFT